MVATVGSIQVAFAADMARYEAALKRGEKATDTAAGRMSRNVQGLEARFSKLGGIAGNFGRGLLAGVAAGGLAGIVSGFGQVANSIASIRDEAQKAGLATKVFQEWKYVAQQARIPVDSVTDAFKELAIRADEFATTGKGSAAEAFARLGMSREEVQAKLRDPSALMLELIERTKALRNTAAGVRLFDELFGGTGGERMVSLLRQGEGEIRRQIQAANDLGIVIDDDLIDAADELDRKFQTVTTTVSTGLKKAIVEAAGALQGFIDRFRQIDARQTETLKAQLTEAEKRLTAAQDAKGRLGGLLDATVVKQIEATQREVDDLRRALVDRKLNEIRPQLESYSAGGVAEKGDRLGYVPPVTDNSGTRDRNAGAARNERDAVAELIAELQHELATLGMNETQKRIANELRRTGADAASKEGQEIAQLVTQIEAERAAQEALEEQQQRLAQAGDYAFGLFSDALGSIADGSVKAEDAVEKLALQLAVAAAQAALLGTGPLAGLFGGGMLGEGWSLPELSGSNAERVNRLADDVGPGVQDARLCAVPCDADMLQMTADAEDRRQVRRCRVDVLHLPHGLHEVDGVRLEAVAA